jgi:putative Holliday junction resolvase
VSRVVGLDHGSRRIGLAVGDTDTGMAFARPALQRRSVAVDLDTIAALARDEEATLVVVGLPRNMDGSEGPQAAAARDFGERLAAIGLEVAYVDERLTSWQAAEQLADEGRRVRRRSGEIDSAAARLILQEYLDAHLPTDPARETE